MKVATAIAVALVAATAAGAAYKPSSLLPLDGAYRMTDGRVVSLAVTDGDGDGLLYTDTRTGDLRQLRAAGPNRFTFGPAYLVQRPVRGTIVVREAKLTIGARRGTRIAVRRQRVAFRGAGVRIVGKVTSPVTPGRHPALAIVHGSEPGGRDGYDLLVNFYNSLGYVVLSYDKRGTGDSSGFYIERPTPANIDNLAGDAVAALGVLAARRDVDPQRLGLVGGSQAGWIIPRAAAKSPLVRFAVIVAGPAMSSGEEEAYAAMTAHGQISPPPTDETIRKGLEGVAPSGFDPRPDLERLSIPTLWIFGREDKSVYTPESVAILEALPTKPTIRVFPAAGHFVLDTPHDLQSELPSAHRFLYIATIAGWVASTVSSPRAVATAHSSPRRRHPEPGRGRPFSRR
jgi:pimeloyl-ACP methyl ester carboxylesterase